uniref:Uncharacterized protein n=1 Tax=Anguilla anguilla TaxID=7936 RepID=A0A0E9XPG3_ANGAN
MGRHSSGGKTDCLAVGGLLVFFFNFS